MTVTSITSPVALPVYSVNEDGQPPWSSIEPQPGPGKLAAPVLSVGTPASTSIPLSWTFTDDGQTGFEIERSPNGTDSWVAQTSAGAAARSATASGLTAETDYWFRIRAVDSTAPSRNSNWSNVVTGRTAVAPDPEAWQLDAGHYMPAKMQPQFVNCFPDAESFSDERHRLAPAGVRFEHNVGIQGGARPLRYDVIDGPAMFTIDQRGVMVWDAPSVGNHTVTIRVRTQDYGRQPFGRLDSEWGEITRTWTMSVVDKDDTSKFVWLAEGGNDGNPGSHASPKATLSHVFESGLFGGKQAHLKAGTFDTDGSASFPLGSNSPRVLNGAGKGTTFLNFTQRVFQVRSHGTYCSNFTTTPGGYSSANIRLFSIDGGWNRKGWYGIRFQDTRMGSVGNDNPACIFGWGVYPNTAPLREFTSIHSCEDVGRDQSSTNTSLLCTLFSETDVAIEYSLGVGVAAGGINLKDSNSRATVAFSDVDITPRTSGGIIVGCQAGRQVSRDIEICYSRVKGDVRLNYQAAYETGPIYLYRCSIQGRVQILRADEATTGPFYIEKNAIETTASVPIQTGGRVVTDGNITAASGMFDADINLLPVYSADIGLVGAQIA